MATIATINKRKQYRTVTLKNVFQALNWSYNLRILNDGIFSKPGRKLS